MPVQPTRIAARPVARQATAAVALFATALLVGSGTALANPVDERTGPLAHAQVLAGQGHTLTPSPLVSKLLRSPLSAGDTLEAGEKLSLPESGESRFSLGAGTAAAHKGTPPTGVTPGQARYRAEATLAANLVPSAKFSGDLGVSGGPHGQLIYLQNVVTEAKCASPTSLTSSTSADGLWLRLSNGELRKVDPPSGGDAVSTHDVPTHLPAAGQPTTDGGGVQPETGVLSDITVRRVGKLADLITQSAVPSRGVEAVAGWRVDLVDYERTPEGGKGAKLGETSFVLGGVLCTTAKDFAPAPEPSTPTVPVKIPAGPADQATALEPQATGPTGTDAPALALLTLTLLGAAGTALVLRRRAVLARQRRSRAATRGRED